MSKPIYIQILLDKSGSMSSCVEDTITSFNKFIKEQKALPDSENVLVTLVQFDTEYEVNYSNLKLTEVPELNTTNYVPRGGTNLYQSLEKLIDNTESVIECLTEGTRPDKTLYVVITDGEDTSRINPAQVKEKIKGYEARGRTFAFLAQGLGHEHVEQTYVRSLGVDKGSFKGSHSVGASYESLSRAVCSYRLSDSHVESAAFWSDSTETPVVSSEASSTTDKK